MDSGLDAEIAELGQVHKGLTGITDNGSELVLSGALPFEASVDGLDTITDSFEIELIIPHSYPRLLPQVREIGGKIDNTYAHIYDDGTLCLAVPIEVRRIFCRQPSLLGFVNKLIIPYLYGYCHWKESGEHPFGEQNHGQIGIAEYYCDTLKLKDETAALAALSYLFEYGYRGHHFCPCGSGSKVRNCHGKALLDLHELHTKNTLISDFLSVLRVLLDGEEAQGKKMSDALRRQVRRIVDKLEHSSGSGSVKSA